MVKIFTQTNIAFETVISFESHCGINTQVKLTQGELEYLKQQVDETLAMFDRVRTNKTP
jgi:hypothetical protein